MPRSSEPGAVETYIRRYLWVTGLGKIVEHDALDSSKPLDSKAVELVESRKSIAQDHFDKMDEEEQAFLREQAQSIKDWFGSSEQGGFDAYREVTERWIAKKRSLYGHCSRPTSEPLSKKQGEKKAA